MTRYPKSGKGTRWTVAELKSIPESWLGDTVADGDGLTGEVRVSSGGTISVRFKSAFKWEGKVTWHQCGTWPSASMAAVREQRDQARQLLKQGVNPNDHKKVQRIDSRLEVEARLADARRHEAEDLTFREMFEAWLADGVSREDGNAELRRAFERDVLPAIGDKPVRQVDDSGLRAALWYDFYLYGSLSAVIAAQGAPRSTCSANFASCIAGRCRASLGEHSSPMAALPNLSRHDRSSMTTMKMGSATVCCQTPRSANSTRSRSGCEAPTNRFPPVIGMGVSVR